ncbi:MAG: general secretion pathway protein GspB [Pseudomonadales bacterium]|nr:general secretion pathway protein GspB [Pseudomonadales bacterium]
MSYILDALKKSEQERQRGDVPNLQSNHISPSVGEEKKAWKAKILWGVAILNVFILVFWIGRGTSNDSIVAQPAEMKPQVLLEEKTEEDKLVGVLDLPEKPPVIMMAPVLNKTFKEELVALKEQSKQSKIPEQAAIVTEKRQSVMNLTQLPAHIREQIPLLEFSSHMYSSMPKYRNVIINGMNLKEQESLDRDLFLEKITENGVILTYQGYRFEVGVIQQWSF